MYKVLRISWPILSYLMDVPRKFQYREKGILLLLEDLKLTEVDTIFIILMCFSLKHPGVCKTQDLLLQLFLRYFPLYPE